MELQQLIEKWEQEMADIRSHIKQHEDTFGHPAAHSRERLEAISNMLADVKQLNLPPVSGSLPSDSEIFEMAEKYATLPNERLNRIDVKRFTTGAKWMRDLLLSNDR